LDTAAPRDSIAPVQSELPTRDRGTTSFLWALLFGVIIWLGAQSIGIPSALAFMVAAVAGFFIFLFVRLCGGPA
jgi:hypothetical protein